MREAGYVDLRRRHAAYRGDCGWMLEIVIEQVRIRGGGHKYDSYFRVLCYDSSQEQQQQVGVD